MHVPPEWPSAERLHTSAVRAVMSQMYVERRTGVLTLYYQDERLCIDLYEGRISAIYRPEGVCGVEQLLEVLDWPEADFEFDYKEPEGRPSEATELAVVLLHHARLRAGG